MQRGDNTNNKPPGSDTTRRARADSSQAEPHRDRAGSSQAEHREGAGSQAEPRREGAGSQAEPLRVVSDPGGHDRHDEGAARRQELDRQQPLDASGNLAERVRATTFTADAKGSADADAKGSADADEKTPILAALARLRTKESARARRGSAPRLRPVPSVGKPPPGRGLVVGGKVKERPKPAAPKSAGRGGPAPRF